MAIKRFDKTEAGSLDYTIEWGDWLTGAELIFSSVWSISPNDTVLVNDLSDISTDGLNAIGWFSSGTEGVTYTLTNTITTDSAPARTTSRSILLTIAETRYLQEQA